MIQMIYIDEKKKMKITTSNVKDFFHCRKNSMTVVVFFSKQKLINYQLLSEPNAENSFVCSRSVAYSFD